MARPEKVLTLRILLRHGSRPDVRLWRNETGVFFTADGGRISCGLCKGSADIIGIARSAKGFGKFVALEVKTTGVSTSPEQLKFIDLIVKMGGIAGVVKSLEDSDFLLGEPPE